MPAPENKSILQNAANAGFASTFAVISDELELVKGCIRRQLVSPDSQTNELLDHVISSNGKMIRPVLVCLSGRSCGQTNNSHTEIAAIIEMVHCATLLHDDVIDQADSRRNMATVNSLWGNKSAVLLGDFMLSKAFAMAANQGQRISGILADTAIHVCQGELQQNTQSDNWRLSESDYYKIIEAKTASLFGCSCRLGAIASGADDKTAKCLSEFGLALVY